MMQRQREEQPLAEWCRARGCSLFSPMGQAEEQRRKNRDARLARIAAVERGEPDPEAVARELATRAQRVPASRDPKVLGAWVDKEFGRAGEERRLMLPAGNLTLRSDKAGNPIVTGYAAVFNSLSEILYEVDSGRFREKIEPGAFTKSLSKDPVVLLLEHRDLPLGSTASGTLKLWEDAHGLKFQSELEPTDPDVQRAVPKIRRGDLNRCSFGFIPIRDKWDYTSKPPTRTLLEVKLTDVSIVVKPAYPATEVNVRQEEAA